jgi:hypothetical protein
MLREAWQRAWRYGGIRCCWTDWLRSCGAWEYASIGMSEFVALLVPSSGGAITAASSAL